MPYNFTYVEFKKQTSKQRGEEKREANEETDSLNYREQTDGYQRGGFWGDG